MADSPGGAAPSITRDDLRPDDRICVAVGNPETRRMLSERVPDHRFATVIAPTAAIDPSAEIGEGAQICDFCFIGSNSTIGKHFQANVRSHVHHDCVVGDYVTFSPAAVCLGTVHISDNVFVGAGAIVRNGSPGRPLTIGKGAVIGMGAVVTKDVEAGATVIGNPAT
jgi:sugar O-acyltransferase (sialic acid O-acetyltransferase NeuD family)